MFDFNHDDKPYDIGLEFIKYLKKITDSNRFIIGDLK